MTKHQALAVSKGELPVYEESTSGVLVVTEAGTGDGPSHIYVLVDRGVALFLELAIGKDKEKNVRLGPSGTVESYGFTTAGV